ncbi:hypothetical protein A2U01_0073628, partial [Trifolium medium]|nr:hypothetical protein [Trifolium medium]
MLMVQLLGSSPLDAERRVKETRGAHTRFTYLKELFKSHLESVAEYTEEGNQEEAEKHQHFEDLEMVNNCYAWGPAALTH